MMYLVETKYRVRFDHHCGTLVIVDDDGNVRIENMVKEVPKGHITMTPPGTITMESTPESHSDGAFVKVYAPDDTEISCEMLDKPTRSRVRIYKSGDIEIVSTGTITLDASNVHVTGDMKIDGSCTHGPCSCG